MIDFRQLSEAFDRVVALPSEQRQAAIQEYTASAPEIAAELQRMLEEFDSDVPTALAGAAERLGLEVPQEERVPNELGTWVIDAELGRGGMGVVYAAHREIEGATQKAAVKWMKRGLDTDALLARFRRERRILATLDHPYIARLIDGGSAQGRPWLAMECVDGMPITEFAREHALDLDARLELMVAVCEAVDHAHKRLVLHRDIKPSNVFVDAEGRVKLLDFGIAKLLDDDEDAVTETAARALTPAYAAPEQLLGEAVSTATDVYALGLLAHVLLTGAHPRDTSSSSLAAAMHSLDQPITAPSARIDDGTRAALKLRSVQRADFDAVLLQALERQPQRRYGSAQSLADDLVALRQHRPVTARRPGSWRALADFTRRHRLLVATVSAALVALSVGLSVALWQAGLARDAAAQAEAALRQSEQHAQRAQSASHFFSSALGRVSQLVLSKGREVSVLDWIDASLSRIDDELSADPAARALVRGALGAALVDIGVPDRGRDELLRALPHLARDSDADRLARVNTLIALSQAENRLGRQDAAGDAIDQALAELATLPQSDEHTRLALSMRTSLMHIRNQQGRYEEGLQLARASLADRIRLFGDGAPETAVDHYNLAASLAQSGDDSGALEHYASAEAAIRATPDPPIARIAWIQTSVAGSLRRLKRFDESAAAIDRAQEVADQYFKPPQEIHAHILYFRALLALDRDQLDQARTSLDAAETMMRQLNMGYLTRALMVRARLLHRASDWEGVRSALDEALSRRPSLASDIDAHAITYRGLRGNLQAHLGEAAAGAAAVQKALDQLMTHAHRIAEDEAMLRSWLVEARSLAGTGP
ncbi:MAG: serine/threonine protein kinase [Xanthomonadales bacterium]|nr:serine/threonine protein kinase [Xanthomonadales bacterium]